MTNGSARGPSSFKQRIVPIYFSMKYIALGILFIITILYFRSPLTPIGSHPDCGRKTTLDGRSRIWSVPGRVFPSIHDNGSNFAEILLQSNDDHRYYGLIYSIEFGLSCPPQHLLTILHIGAAALQNPSSICMGGCPNDPKYHSSASWSHRPNGTQLAYNSGMIVRGV